MDSSTSGQVWVPENDTKWGPFAGHMLRGVLRLLAVGSFFDEVNGGKQGGTFKIPLKFNSGMMRPRFNPTDGQMYVAGLRGWSSSAAKEGSLQRVRYTGKPVTMPVGIHLTKTGFEVTFSSALDPAIANDKQNFSAEWFNIVRSGSYGSPDYSVADPKKKARDPVEISGAALQPNGKTVALTIPNLKPVTNFVLKYKLKATDGSDAKGEVDYTINRVP